MDKYNDWYPEVLSLIHKLQAAGFTITGGNNGENEFEAAHPDFIGELCACDESTLFLTAPDGKKLWIYLVFGNSPGELPSDYSVHPLLDEVTEKHGAEWETKGQPMILQADHEARSQQKTPLPVFTAPDTAKDNHFYKHGLAIHAREGFTAIATAADGLSARAVVDAYNKAVDQRDLALRQLEWLKARVRGISDYASHSESVDMARVKNLAEMAIQNLPVA